MTNYGFGKDRVIEAGGLPLFRLVAIVVVGFFIVIFLFAAVAKVPSGHVGVLTLFGRVTGEVLPEGMHLVNPFKTNNVMSIRTEQVKESANVPSSEGLVMSLDTSLLFHLNPGQAADLYQPHRAQLYRDPGRAQPARRHPRGYRVALGQCALHRGAREGGAGDQHSTHARAGEARRRGGERVAPRHSASCHAEGLHRNQAAGRAGIAGHVVPPAKREAGGGSQTHRSPGHPRLPADRRAGLLEWKGIEATESLARSPNTKVVVIGNSKNGLPLILGQ